MSTGSCSSSDSEEARRQTKRKCVISSEVDYAFPSPPKKIATLDQLSTVPPFPESSSQAPNDGSPRKSRNRMRRSIDESQKVSPVCSPRKQLGKGSSPAVFRSPKGPSAALIQTGSPSGFQRSPQPGFKKQTKKSPKTQKQFKSLPGSSKSSLITQPGFVAGIVPIGSPTINIPTNFDLGQIQLHNSHFDVTPVIPTNLIPPVIQPAELRSPKLRPSSSMVNVAAIEPLFADTRRTKLRPSSSMVNVVETQPRSIPVSPLARPLSACPCVERPPEYDPSTQCFQITRGEHCDSPPVPQDPYNAFLNQELTNSQRLQMRLQQWASPPVVNTQNPQPSTSRGPAASYNIHSKISKNRPRNSFLASRRAERPRSSRLSRIQQEPQVTSSWFYANQQQPQQVNQEMLWMRNWHNVPDIIIPEPTYSLSQAAQYNYAQTEFAGIVSLHPQPEQVHEPMDTSQICAGFTSNVTPNPFGTSAFGKPAQTGFGAQPAGFGATVPLFGQTSQHGTSLFAQTQPTASFGQTITAQPTFGNSMFGSTATQSTGAGMFGTPNTAQAFGQQNKAPAFGFGQNTQTTGFFGAQNNPAQPQQSTNLFGAQNSQNLFGSTSAFGGATANNQMGTVLKFTPVTGTDTMVKGNVSQTISTRHHCITCMKEYEGKSLEELRWEDYQVNRKGPQQGQQQTAGLFGNMSAPAVGGALFGQNTTPATNSNLFGQQENKSVFGNATQSGFGQQNTAFGVAPAPNAIPGGMFGKPLTTSFGTNVSTTSTFPFNSSSQSTNLFGQTNVVKPFGQTTQQPSLFGQAQTPGFGAQSSFGTFSTPANQNTGLFNSNKNTPFNVNTSITAGGFGAFGQNMAQNTGSLFPGAKPSSSGFGNFGAPTNAAPIFGQSSFGQTNQPLFNTSFNKTTPLFGQGNTTNPIGGGMGSGQGLFSQNTNKPNTMFGNNMGVFNSGFGNTPNNAFNISGTNQQVGNVNCDPNQASLEQQIHQMSATPYGIQNLLNNVSEVDSDVKNSARPTNPCELTALLNTVNKSPANSPAEKLQPVQVYGRKVPMFDGLEHKDEILISNIRMNQNPKRLVVRNNMNNNEEMLNSNDSSVGNSNDYSTDTSFDNSFNNKENANITKSPSFAVARNDCTNLLEIEHKQAEARHARNLQKTNLHKAKVVQDGEHTDIPPFSSTMIATPKRVSFSPVTIEAQERSDKGTETRGRHVKSPNSIGINVNLSDITHKVVPNTIKTSEPIKPHVTGIILSRAEYYTVPPLDDLVKHISEDGTCIVKGFTIGREGYGNVHYPEAFDVSNLNLDEIVHFRHKEINVYPDEAQKVPLGTGLNRRAQVTLDKVWPFDRKANLLISDLKSLAELDYAGKLRRLCEKQGTRFVEYRPDTGSWVFKVEHFSKYGVTDSDESDQEVNVTETNILPVSQLKQKPKSTAEMAVRETASQVEMINITDSYTQRTNLQPQNGLYCHTLDSFGSYNKMDEIIPEECLKYNLMRNTFFNETQQDEYLVTEINSPERQIQYHSKRVNLIEDQEKLARDPYQEVMYMEERPIDNENLPMNVFGENAERRNAVANEMSVDVLTLSRNKIMAALESPSATRINIHNQTNICALKSKSFKVCWDLHNTWYAVPPNDPDYRLNNFSLTPVENEFTSNIKHYLDLHMRCQLSLSKVTVKHGIPTFVSKPGCDLLYAHQELLQNNPKHDYNRQIWNLCSALWGDLNQHDLEKYDGRTIRNQLFHKWIKEAIKVQVPDWLRKLPIENVLGYLSSHHISEAAKMAFRNKYSNLATYIAQLPSTPIMRTIMTEQIDEWAESDGYTTIKDSVLKLVLLVAGKAFYQFPEKTLVVHENWDWLRTLSLYFWYVVEPAKPLSHAVEMYESQFMTTAYTAKPIPEYNRHCTTTYDLRFMLMKYYANCGQPLITLLDPATHTSDPLDYRLSWLLMQVMTSLGHINISESQKLNIHTQFATQLEQQGHWHWAIFVLLFIKEAVLKSKLVNGIIERNVKLLNEATRDYITRERMLTEDFKIPTQWIDSAKAILAKQNKQYKEAIQYNFNSNNWNEAHNIIMQNFMAENFMCYDYEFIQQLLKQLSNHSRHIANWECTGGLILDFTKLSDDFKAIMTLTTQIVIREKLGGFRGKIMSMSLRFTGFPTITYMHDVCLAVMSTKVSTMLRELLKLTEATIEDYTDAAATITDLPMTGDSMKQEIHAILRDYLAQSNTKTSYIFKKHRPLLSL